MLKNKYLLFCLTAICLGCNHNRTKTVSQKNSIQSRIESKNSNTKQKNIKIYLNEKLEVEFTYDIDEKINGPYKNYYESGKLMTKTNITNGILCDTLYGYYENGNLEVKGKMYNNRREGWWSTYNKEGKLNSRIEFFIHKDSSYTNQEIFYLKNGEIDLNKSTFFELTIPDTIPLGKSLADVKRYVGKRKIKDHYLWVVVDNEYEKGIIKKDTFSDGSFTPGFGIFSRKKGNNFVKGIIVEQLLIDSPTDSSLDIIEYYKHFKKEVFVKDTVSN